MRITDYTKLNRALLNKILSTAIADDKESGKTQKRGAKGTEEGGQFVSEGKGTVSSSGKHLAGKAAKKNAAKQEPNNLTAEQSDYYAKYLDGHALDKAKFLQMAYKFDDGHQTSQEILEEPRIEDDRQFDYPWEQLQQRNMTNRILEQNGEKPKYDMKGIPNIEVAVTPEVAGGVKRGHEMSHQEAGNGNTNPNFAKEGYGDNCATCVLTYLLRRKGFDVTAKPMKDGMKTDQLANDPASAYLSAVKTKDELGNPVVTYKANEDDITLIPLKYIASGKTSDFINKKTASDPDGAIYLLHLEYADQKGLGHEFAMRKEDGHITIFDVQGDAETQKRIERVFPDDAAQNKQIAKKGGEGTFFMRIDNKYINPHYITGSGAVIETAKTVAKAKKVSPKRFAKALLDAKNSMPDSQRWKVSTYDAQHYIDGEAKTFTMGGSTVAVDKNGDIISVCTNSNGGARGSELLELAVKNGGVKLDSFDGNYRFYTKNGFEPVSWTKFNREFAPEGWTDDFGEQDIVFFRYVGKGNVTPEFTGPNGMKNFYENVEVTDDYDEAMLKRDKAIQG